MAELAPAARAQALQHLAWLEHELGAISTWLAALDGEERAAEALDCAAPRRGRGGLAFGSAAAAAEGCAAAGQLSASGVTWEFERCQGIVTDQSDRGGHHHPRRT